MNFSLYTSLFLFSFLFAIIPESFQLDCSNQTVTFSKNLTSFSILNDPTDLTPKSCIYQFKIPTYYVPTVKIGSSFKLSVGNFISVRQTTDYYGPTAYQVMSNMVYKLAPVDFQIVISLRVESPKELFNITISTVDTTPQTNLYFTVDPDLAHILTGYDLLPRRKVSQNYQQNQSSLNNFSIRVALYSGFSALENILKNVHVYDGLHYKGNLRDVYISTVPCIANKFNLINTNPAYSSQITVLVSAKYNLPGNVQLNSIYTGKYTEAFQAPMITHNILSVLYSTDQLKYYSNLVFTSNGLFDLYAGCVTIPLEKYRIATITPDNIKDYETLLVSGQCNTLVMRQGIFQWTKNDAGIISDVTDINVPIGRKGVIMSFSYPYPELFTLDKTFLVHPQDSTKSISIMYDVAFIGSNSTVNVGGGGNTYQGLTTTGQKFTSAPGKMQNITLSYKENTKGVMIRYTVMNGSVNTLRVLFIASFVFVTNF